MRHPITLVCGGLVPSKRQQGSLDEEFEDAQKLLKNLRPNVKTEQLLEADALMLQAVRGDYDLKVLHTADSPSGYS